MMIPTMQFLFNTTQMCHALLNQTTRLSTVPCHEVPVQR